MASGRAGAAAAGAVLAGVLGVALWWRRNPSPCPYGQRFWVELPHPSITRARLGEILGPAAGQSVLEVGPGTGYYSLDVANRLGEGGRLATFDIQQEMLDHTHGRAREAGLVNVGATRGDARALPYADDEFDAAFICMTLGEVPDVDAALGELRRVLRSGGRLVVGESYLDPHVVRPSALRERAEAAGLSFERRTGGPAGYFARFSA
jgi:SAM-dependent methyltransferase